MFGTFGTVKASGPVTETPLRLAVRETLARLAPHLPTLPGFGSPAPFLSLALSKVSDADLDTMVRQASAELAALAAVAESRA